MWGFHEMNWWVLLPHVTIPQLGGSTPVDRYEFGLIIGVSQTHHDMFHFCPSKFIIDIL